MRLRNQENTGFDQLSVPGFDHKSNRCSQKAPCLRRRGNHRVVDFVLPRETTMCADCSGASAASRKGCELKKEDEASLNQPFTLNEFFEILSAVKRIITHAVGKIRVIKSSEFDLTHFSYECKVIWTKDFIKLVLRPFSMPPESNKHESQETDTPPAHWQATTTALNNYNNCDWRNHRIK